jgi:hypothetical protein
MKASQNKVITCFFFFVTLLLSRKLDVFEIISTLIFFDINIFSTLLNRPDRTIYLVEYREWEML